MIWIELVVKSCFASFKHQSIFPTWRFFSREEVKKEKTGLFSDFDKPINQAVVDEIAFFEVIWIELVVKSWFASFKHQSIFPTWRF